MCAFFFGVQVYAGVHECVRVCMCGGGGDGARCVYVCMEKNYGRSVPKFMKGDNFELNIFTLL